MDKNNYSTQHQFMHC